MHFKRAFKFLTCVLEEIVFPGEGPSGSGNKLMERQIANSFQSVIKAVGHDWRLNFCQRTVEQHLKLSFAGGATNNL